MVSFLVRCFCRPFLKGGDDGRRDFYDLLEVSQDAGTEDIKRAYKRKSLALHPDKLAQRGQVLTPEDQARFQRVKEAYEVLVDPKRRDLYDECVQCMQLQWLVGWVCPWAHTQRANPDRSHNPPHRCMSSGSARAA